MKKVGRGFASTIDGQTTTLAATIKYVSAGLFAYPAPTKTKPGSPRANHVQVALFKTKWALPVAMTIAMLDHILTPTKVPV